MVLAGISVGALGKVGMGMPVARTTWPVEVGENSICGRVSGMSSQEFCSEWMPRATAGAEGEGGLPVV